MHCIINNLVPSRFNVIGLKALVKVGVQKVRTKSCFGMVESASDPDRRLNSIVWTRSRRRAMNSLYGWLILFACQDETMKFTYCFGCIKL